MNEVCVIRHKVLVEGQSLRAVARQMGVSRHTVKRYVGGAAAEVRHEVTRASPVRERAWPRIEALLGEMGRWTAGKQRLTATRLHRMLADEGIAVSDRTVRQLVAEWKRQRREVFVPLSYEAGDLAEADFFEVLVDVTGVRQKAWMFVLRLMHSGRDFAWLYPRQDQTCFLDGHVRAFAHFGGVPHRIVYDNLKAAVSKILVGSERELSRRFVALTTHYLFEASFARPRTGHDKGGVESRGRAIRWQHLVPIPAGPDLDTISAALLSGLDGRMSVPNAEAKTIADRFDAERPRLLPLADRPFSAAKVDHAEVSRRSLVTIGQASYSVWSEWAGLAVVAHVGVSTLDLVGPDGRRVAHRRQPKGGRSIDYRHYLPELGKKPQAVRQVVEPLLRDLGPPYDALWRDLVEEHGVKQAARLFARVLRSIVELGHEVVSERVQLALSSGEPVLLALRPARKTESQIQKEALPQLLRDVEVVSRLAADYDVLLGGAA